MRTTLTVDDDLVAKLKQRARERGVPFRQVVNDALRAGIEPRQAGERAYELPELGLRSRPEVDLRKALALAGELEDRELVRKLARGR